MNSLAWNGTGPWTEKTQCKWILRRGLTDLSYNAKVSTYFLMKEYPGSHNRRNYKGLIQLEDTGNKKPAWNVYRNLISSLRHETTSIKNYKVKYKITNTGSFHGVMEKNKFSVLLKDHNDKPYFTYWLPTRIQDTVTSGSLNLKLQDPGFEEPVLKDMMTGKIYGITEWNLKDGWLEIDGLPLTDYPFLLTNK